MGIAGIALRRFQETKTALRWTELRDQAQALSAGGESAMQRGLTACLALWQRSPELCDAYLKLGERLAKDGDVGAFRAMRQQQHELCDARCPGCAAPAEDCQGTHLGCRARR